MKKILLGLMTLSIGTFALELDSVELESGLRGFEIETNFYRENLNDQKSVLLPIAEKYSLIRANNSFIKQTMLDDNTDRENVYKIAYNHSELNDSRATGFNLLYFSTLDEEERVGISFNYSKLDSEYENLDLKGDFYQLNLFFNKKDYHEMREIFWSGYLGTSNEDNKILEYKTKFIGLYGKYTEEIDVYYDDIIPKFYLEIDLKRLQSKFKDEKTEKKNNDSVNLGIGFEVAKIIHREELKVSLTPIIGYNHEFLEDRIYNYKGIKDQFQDEVKAGIEIKFEYEEITKFFARYEVKKSLNTSNYDNVVTVGFKVMI
ncbi:MAG: hypothetical protein ACRDB9_08540 [Cetobacterium sp.]